MTDRPILFSASMIRALLDGRKTQTRRVLKPQPIINEAGLWRIDFGRRGFAQCHEDYVRLSFEMRGVLPYAPGDRLWVRETWHPDPGPRPSYAADFTGDPAGFGWRPSIHMPRSASRPTLTVTDVRVQRVQEISEADAIAEGVVQTWGDFRGDPPSWALRPGEDDDCFYDNRTSVENFALLWNSLNAKRGFGWDANPWCVAISFRCIPKNIDSLTGDE